MSKAANYKPGIVILADLGQPEGHEQGGPFKPCVIVAVPRIGEKIIEILIVVPVTSIDRGWPTHVKINKGDGGIKTDSVAQCEQIRAISFNRVKDIWGTVQVNTLLTIKLCLRKIMGF